MSDSVQKYANKMQRRRRRSRRSGAAAVEAALLSPLLLIVTLGAVDIGQYINVSQSVSNASRVGTRQACRDSTVNVSEVKESVYDYFRSTFPHLSEKELQGALQISVLDREGNSIANGDLSTMNAGDEVAVVVTLDFSVVRWVGSIDYWNLSLDPYTTYGRRE